MTPDLRHHILVIEDDATTAETLKKRLETAGFQVSAVESGKAAMNWAFRQIPDLVILDLRLPDMSGYEVCRHLRKLYNSWTLPILMLTGMNEPVDQLRGFAHGADAYLTKPYDPAELIKTVSVLLGEPLSAL